MFTIKVKATGHGLSYNTYPVDFEFTMNGTPLDWDEDEIFRRARLNAQKKSACNSVTLEEVTWD